MKNPINYLKLPSSTAVQLCYSEAWGRKENPKNYKEENS